MDEKVTNLVHELHQPILLLLTESLDDCGHVGRFRRVEDQDECRQSQGLMYKRAGKREETVSKAPSGIAAKRGTGEDS